MDKPGATVKQATFADAIKVAQTLNLNKESVWMIIQGRNFSTLTDLALAVQAAFDVHEMAIHH
jgi:hypothetical protein